MTPFKEARKILRREASCSLKLAIETVDLADALGRVCADNVYSPDQLPNFDNSAMDGFAVRSNEVQQVPLMLKVLGSIAAGDPPPKMTAGEGAWEIMTGAPFPEGFDSCVRIEDTRRISETEVEILKAPNANQNRRLAGEDFTLGTLLLKKGRKLRAEEILILASVGVTEISVFKNPRIAVITSGHELIPANEKPGPGQLRNSNGPYVLAALKARGLEATFLGNVADDAEDFEKKIEGADFDLILTTGAISMGKYDFIAPTLTRLNAEVFFKKVAIRPGKPLLFSKLPKGPFVISLPGNPVATAVGLRFFVDEFIRAALHQDEERPLRVPLLADTKKPEGLTTFLKVSISKEGLADTHPDQKASMMRGLLETNYWLALEDPRAQISKGELVDVYPFLPSEN